MLDNLKKLIQAKESRQIIHLLEEHPEILDLQDENGTSGFFLITYSGDGATFEIAKFLKKEFDFYEAIVSGKLDLVKGYLSTNKKKINEYSKDGFTPLALGAFFNQTTIAKFLLSAGADPNLPSNNPSKVNALHAAVAKNNEELCRLFLEKGADPNRVQTQQVTPLHSAAHQGNLSIVKLLLEYGADISLKMDNGDDAYSIAVRDGHEEVAALLK